MSKINDFLSVYRLYRVKHSRRYAARLAYEIAIKGHPF
jgi:hypothetical protein